ncbi:MAG: (2Fe-2S)-binding protein [Roseibium sp.]
MAKTALTFTLNDAEAAVFVDPGAPLIDVLRRGVGDLTPKHGCGQGACGACTVLINGQAHLSCLTLAESVEGKTVETTAGLAGGPNLHALQDAFIEGFAAQCGFCTTGMLMAAKALLDANPNPSRTDVIEAISGNLCRCTGYEPIVDAVLSAAARLQGRTA